MNRRYSVCVAIGLPIALIGCQNPIEGVQLRVKDPIQDGVVEFRFYDPAGNPLPPANTVKIAGPDADRVVTTLNTTRYKINPDGNLLVAASPLVRFSDQQPFRFTAVVEAEGYLAVVHPVMLTKPARLTRLIRRINLSKPPRTLQAARTTGRADGNGLVTTAVELTTPPQAEGADRATVRISTGTRLTDRDGQTVGGDLTMSVIHTNARTAAAAGQVPGGGILSAVNGPNGALLGTLRTTSLAGSVALELYNERYQLAKLLSQPARWTMDLNPATVNLKAGRPVQAGDTIPLFSYDAFANRWQLEKPGVVEQDRQTQRLVYRAEATHAATYVAAWTELLCDLGPVFRVSSNLTNVDVNYYCRLIDAQTGVQTGAFYANLNNGSLVSIYNQVRGRRLKLRVYDETDAWGKGAKGGLIAESTIGTTCDTKAIAINLSGLPVPPVMKLEFNFSCPGGTRIDESALPAQVRTQYSEVGKEVWRELITVTRTERRVASYKLQVGRRYDLRASTDGGATWPLRENNHLIDKPEWVLKIRASMYCK